MIKWLMVFSLFDWLLEIKPSKSCIAWSCSNTKMTHGIRKGTVHKLTMLLIIQMTRILFIEWEMKLVGNDGLLWLARQYITQ